jgi:hypothetical protein
MYGVVEDCSPERSSWGKFGVRMRWEEFGGEEFGYTHLSDEVLVNLCFYLAKIKKDEIAILMLMLMLCYRYAMLMCIYRVKSNRA